MSFKKVLRVLKTLPKEERFLARGQYVFLRGRRTGESCGCAVGKVMPSLYKYAPEANRNGFAFEDLFGEAQRFDLGEIHFRNPAIKKLMKGISKDLENLNCTLEEMNQLQTANDDYAVCGLGTGSENSRQVREARYNYVIEWLETKVAEEKARRSVG